jgi:hypothetical protein
MKMRIVLSVLLAFMLALAACGETSNPGIGTSPSDQGDDPVAQADPEPVCIGEEVGKPCGVWVAADEATADAVALAGGEPNLVMFTRGSTYCLDAVAIADQRWPGRSVVRYVGQVWRAEGAR